MFSKIVKNYQNHHVNATKNGYQKLFNNLFKPNLLIQTLKASVKSLAQFLIP